MKAMTRTELAERAGVSRATLDRFIMSHHDQLAALGYEQRRKLRPNVVAWIVRNYGIDADAE